MNETIERLKSLVEVYESCAEGNFRPVESAKKAEALSKAIKALELLPELVIQLETWCIGYANDNKLRRETIELIQKSKGVDGE
jgi:hypothetical protein